MGMRSSSVYGTTPNSVPGGTAKERARKVTVSGRVPSTSKTLGPSLLETPESGRTRRRSGILLGIVIQVYQFVKTFLTFLFDKTHHNQFSQDVNVTLSRRSSHSCRPDHIYAEGPHKDEGKGCS